MKVPVVLIACMVLMASAVFAQDKLELKTQKEKQSYAIGANMGKGLKKSGVDVDAEIVLRALKDALVTGTSQMTDEEISAAITALQKDMMAKQQEQMKTLGEKNKKEGEAFLKANKKKKGVKTLDSGLQYKVMTEGKGKTPKATDTVTVNYKGTLIDGTEFDSSYKRGQPATFPVNGVIKGWTEALQLMKEGAKWQLFIPAELAYGETGNRSIPPSSALIFEVELISVKAEK